MEENTSIAEFTDEQMRKQNNQYRDKKPSSLHTAAYRAVLNGETVPERELTEMVDRLYEPFPDHTKNHPVDPFETVLEEDTGNGLGKAVTCHERCIEIHISSKLFRQQPIGVLLRPINDAVRKKGEATITSIEPRSDSVEADIMPAEHVKLTIEPLPIWLNKWVGDNGYPEL
jgi:hypothetical protein